MLDLTQTRSLLFVPAHVARFVEKAPASGADAVILDLEDSVPDAQKDAARAALKDAVASLGMRGLTVLVRINHDATLAPLDVAAAVAARAHGLVMPKIDSAGQVESLARGAGRLGVLVQVESVHALPHLDAIAHAPRVAGINLGVDDFCHSAGALPSIESLLLPTQMLLYAARRAGIAPLGYAGSVSNYADLDAFRALARHARGLGFRGATCIHPSQVAVLNEEFAPSAAEIEDARAVLAAYEAGVAQGRGAVALNGRMIDAPVVARARALLARSAAK